MTTNLTPSQWAALRNILAFLAGLVASMGLISATGAQSLVDSFMQIGTAVASILTALAAIVPVVTAAIASHKASPDQQKIAVRSIPNTLVITTTPQASDIGVAKKLEAMPEIAEVVAAPAVAAATGPKVVSTPTVTPGEPK